jgi:monoamine oxidase
MSEHARINFTLDYLDKVYPGEKAEFEVGMSVCWDNDPWALGDFAWFRPGQLLGLREVVKAPEGRIHFAGEHTSDWPGWMQGAIASGLRAATEVASRVNS